jgi:rRNA maturation RNase YbeY
LTDILTFPFTEQPDTISGDIYISIERVEENAKSFGEPKHMELLRVMIHGVLHLIGYKDKTETEKKKMSVKENYYLNLFKNSEIAR